MTLKDIAQDFLELAAKGDSYKAFELYVSKKFKHHNPYFKEDANTLMQAMKEAAEKNPNKTLKIYHVLEDQNLVVIHSHIKQNDDDLGIAVVHIFKFEENKIVELWDLGQAIPNEIVNKLGMF